MRGTPYQFINAKIDAFDTVFSQPGLRVMFSHALDDLARLDGEAAFQRAKKLDRDIESFVGIFGDRGAWRGSREYLKNEYGVDRLGVCADDFVDRVLKRGSIGSDEEAEAVRNYISNDSNESEIGKRKFSKLAKILDEAGY